MTSVVSYGQKGDAYNPDEGQDAKAKEAIAHDVTHGKAADSQQGNGPEGLNQISSYFSGREGIDGLGDIYIQALGSLDYQRALNFPDPSRGWNKKVNDNCVDK